MCHGTALRLNMEEWEKPESWVTLGPGAVATPAPGGVIDAGTA